MAGSFNLYFLAPSSGQTVYNTRYNSYTAVNGIITVSPPSQWDIVDLMQMGCIPVTYDGQRLLGQLIGANMNVTTDQAFAMTPWAQGKWRPTKITAINASISLTTAAGGIYPAKSKGGTAVVTSGQAYSGLTGATLALDLTIDTVPAETVYAANQQWYLSLTTGQGAAATADLYIFGDVYL